MILSIEKIHFHSSFLELLNFARSVVSIAIGSANLVLSIQKEYMMSIEIPEEILKRDLGW